LLSGQADAEERCLPTAAPAAKSKVVKHGTPDVTGKAEVVV
jgi:LysR family transcriptional regulator, regulator for bpeEF and oprC